MIHNSRIIGGIITIIQICMQYVQRSLSYGIYDKFARWLGRTVDNSRIMSFFYRDWDQVLKPSKSQLSNISFKKLMTVGAKYRVMSNPVKKQVENSFFFSLINQKVIFLLVTLLAFIIPFAPTMASAALCAGILILYIMAILFGRIKLHKPNLVDIGFFAFGLCYIFGTFTSYNVVKGIQVLVLVGAFMLMFYVLEESIKTEKELKIFINSLLISGVLVSLYGIYQYIIGVEMDRAWVDEQAFGDMTTRVFSTLGNPNVLGEYLIVITSLAVGMLWREKQPMWKLYYLGVVGITTVCLLLTGSRASMMGLIIALGFFVLLAEKRIIPLGIIGLLLLPFILPDSIWNRLASVTNLTDSSALYRISIYTASINMIKNYWVSGIGLEAFNMVYPMFSLEAANAYHSHNTFLQVFIELGVVGFTTFLLFVGLFFQKLYATTKKVNKSYKILIGVVFGAFFGLLLQGLADHIWFDYQIVMLFWVLIGLGMAIMRVGEKTS